MATLSRRYHAEVPQPAEAFRVERAAIYAGIPNDPEDPANLFRIAIAFEQRAVRFFTEHGARCAEGSAEWQLYRELAAEEREHADLLAIELERFKQGKPGLLYLGRLAADAGRRARGRAGALSTRRSRRSRGRSRSAAAARAAGPPSNIIGHL